jgi:hypothetical protein
MSTIRPAAHTYAVGVISLIGGYGGTPSHNYVSRECLKQQYAQGAESVLHPVERLEKADVMMVNRLLSRGDAACH